VPVIQMNEFLIYLLPVLTRISNVIVFMSELCCIFRSLHTSGGTDEIEVAEKIKKKCEPLLHVMKMFIHFNI